MLDIAKIQVLVSLASIRSFVNRNKMLAIGILSLLTPVFYFAPLLTLTLLAPEFSSNEKLVAALVLPCLYLTACALLLRVMKFRTYLPFFANLGVAQSKYFNSTLMSLALLSLPLTVLWFMPLAQAKKVDWSTANWPLFAVTLLVCMAIQCLLPRVVAHIRTRGRRIGQIFGLPVIGIERLLGHLVLFACIPLVTLLEFSPTGTYFSVFALWFASAVFGVRWIQAQDRWLVKHSAFFTLYTTRATVNSIWFGWFSMILGIHLLLSHLFVANYSGASSLIYVSNFVLWPIAYYLRRNQHIDVIIGAAVFAISQAPSFVNGYYLP